MSKFFDMQSGSDRIGRSNQIQHISGIPTNEADAGMVSKETLLNQDAAAAEPRSEARSEKAPNSSETMKKHLFFCKAQVPSGVIKLNLAGISPSKWRKFQPAIV